MGDQRNYFDLLGLPVDYKVDTQRLELNFKKLQKQFHPDRYATATAGEQRLAMQMATLINTAYETLNSPVGRGLYLLELNGLAQEDRTLKSDPDFLFEQMAWREKLSAASSVKQMQDLLEKTDLNKEDFEAQFDQQFNAGNFLEAQQVIDKLQFVVKFRSELLVRLSTMKNS
ncbi:MAG: Fe-S protein assembly co-chaperone HscB [Cellvibrionales bacterium]|nr:Fe-S protein assembly co-chaperone HscB [Cellvibrionales bacterium]